MQQDPQETPSWDPYGLGIPENFGEQALFSDFYVDPAYTFGNYPGDVEGNSANDWTGPDYSPASDDNPSFDDSSDASAIS
jgi:hypothetical protein